MTQKTFNPANYGFEWKDGWYTWDRNAAHKAALQDRNAEAKRLQAQGLTIRKSSLGDQLITLGGAHSGKPEIDLVVTVYMVEAV